MHLPPKALAGIARGRATRRALANPEDWVEQTFRDPETGHEFTEKVLPRQGPGGTGKGLLDDLTAFLAGRQVTLPKGVAEAVETSRLNWLNSKDVPPERGLDLFGPARPDPLVGLLEGLFRGRGLHPKAARNAASRRVIEWLRTQEGQLQPLQSTPEDFLFGEPSVKPRPPGSR